MTIHDSRLLRLGWLLPVTFAAHAFEEWRWGFPAWWSRVVGVELSVGRFLALNRFAVAGMAVGVALAYLSPPLRWLFVSFATAVFVNGCAHLLASALTLSYSPGAVTGTLLWLPLGALVVTAGRRALSRRAFAAGVAVGLAIHASVVLLALTGG